MYCVFSTSFSNESTFALLLLKCDDLVMYGLFFSLLISKSIIHIHVCFDLSWILFNVFQAFLHTKRLECPLCHLQWRRSVPFWSLWNHHNNLNLLFSAKWFFMGMQGNIARWLKKEGDKVAPGEVLCEVETVGSLFCLLVEVQLLIKILGYVLYSLWKIDSFLLIFIWFLKDKATVEMESMEEGYLAKIIHGDGSKEIKVGEVMSLCYCTATQVYLCVCACVHKGFTEWKAK